jgi:ABC-type nitrate/sulfonate/bicarbonate transport system permease component
MDWEWRADGSLFGSMGATISRILAGWLLASAIGILLGAAIGGSRLVDRLIMPTLDALRLPASAFILVAVLILGLNESMSIVVIAFGSLWSVSQCAGGAARGCLGARNEANAQRSYRSADLYAALLTIGVIGLVINQMLLVAEKRMFPWLAR